MTTAELRQYFPTAGAIEIHPPRKAGSVSWSADLPDKSQICLCEFDDGRHDAHLRFWVGHGLSKINGRECKTELAAIKSLAREVRKFCNRIMALVPEVK